MHSIISFIRIFRLIFGDRLIERQKLREIEQSRLSVREVADVLSTSEAQVIDLIQTGQLLARKREGQYYVDEEILDIYVKRSAH